MTISSSFVHISMFFWRMVRQPLRSLLSQRLHRITEFRPSEDRGHAHYKRHHQLSRKLSRQDFINGKQFHILMCRI